MEWSVVKTKDRIRSYIEAKLRLAKGGEVGPFTKEAILANLPADAVEVGEVALKELDDDGLLSTHVVHAHIYLPRNPKGRKQRRLLIENGFLMLSPYWLIFGAIVVVWLLYPRVAAAPPDLQGSSPDIVYQAGVADGIILAALLGVGLGFALHRGLNALLRHQQINPPTFEFLARAGTISTFLAIFFGALYFAGSFLYPYTVKQEGFLAAIGAAVALGAGAAAATRKPRQN